MRLSPIKAMTACAALALGLAVSGASMANAPQGTRTEVYKAHYALSYVLGSKRAIGYFTRTAGVCRVTLMIAEAVDPDVVTPTSATRLVMSMRPGESAGVSSAENESITLTCGDGAETMQVTYTAAARS